MKREFHLSDYRFETPDGIFMPEKYVKEFIKKREKVIQAFLMGEIGSDEMWFELNKLVGDKLS